MLGAIVASQSRSGTIGLAVMIVVLGGSIATTQAGVAVAGVLALLLALPLMPVVVLAPDLEHHRRIAGRHRLAEKRGGPAARVVPGVPGTIRSPASAPVSSRTTTRKAASKPGARATTWCCRSRPSSASSAWAGSCSWSDGPSWRRPRPGGCCGLPAGSAGGTNAARARRRVTPAESEWLQSHTAAMTAALAGWFFCALFASVAYNWTFYYLLALAVAPREFLIDRLGSRRARQRTAAAQRRRATCRWCARERLCCARPFSGCVRPTPI